MAAILRAAWLARRSEAVSPTGQCSIGVADRPRSTKSKRFRLDAAEAFAPSMRQHLDVAKLYARARYIMPETIDGQPPLPVPEACAMTLDELLDDQGGH
jgi:hypothetical protein